MSNQPPYGDPSGGGYPPPGGGYPPPPGKTKVLGLDYSIAGLLCYLPICCINVIASIIFLVSEPRENKVLRFHALQSLLLAGVFIVIWIVFSILGVGTALSPSDMAGAAGGGILFLLQVFVGLIFLVLYIMGMVKAYQQQIWKIPVIGDIADKNT